jgi:ketosteroid isomerase-like protein
VNVRALSASTETVRAVLAALDRGDSEAVDLVAEYRVYLDPTPVFAPLAR